MLINKSKLIKNRKVNIFTCYHNNISENIIKYQKLVFEYFGMELIQEQTTLHHGEYLNSKISSLDFDIIIFFDIDAIPLKPNLCEYIIDQISDNNSLIGIEQAANHIDSNFIYAGPACFAITKIAYEKLGKPSFMAAFTEMPRKQLTDVAGNFTIAAKKYDVNVKLFNIISSLNNKWKCDKKYFGNGTIYDDWIYHQFEIRYYPNNASSQQICEYQFINKCKDILGNNSFNEKS